MAIQQNSSPSNEGANTKHQQRQQQASSSSSSKLVVESKMSSSSAAAATTSSSGGEGKLKDDTTTTTNLPTYESTKQSLLYAQAKHDLEEGNFDDALVKIEEQLVNTMKVINDDELHSSLAPLYYLYGTTLLYSVEESNQDSMTMTVPQQNNAPSEIEEEEEQEDPATMSAEVGSPAAATGANTTGGDEDAASPVVDTSTEDLQIAWENLEMARSILDKVVDSPSTSTTTNNKEMARDLAQIHQRLGDLQKANGNYQSAAEDYEQCISILEQIADPSITITPDDSTKKGNNTDQTQHNIIIADRKIANAHHSLATTYMLLAAEGEKELTKEASSSCQPPTSTDASENPILAAVAAAAAQISEDQDEDSEQKKKKLNASDIAYYRKKSVLHHLETGKCFAALMANVCGENILEEDDSFMLFESNYRAQDGCTSSNVAVAAGAAAAASSSSSSQPKNANEKEDGDSLSRTIETSSKVLNKIRDMVKPWEALLENDKASVDDWKDLLDEIQETIDNTEIDSKVLRETAMVNTNQEQQIANEDAKDSLTVAGPTTTIGFGQPTSAATAEAIMNAPMLIPQKKKKKRPTPATADGSTNAEDTSSKKVKPNE